MLDLEVFGSASCFKLPLARLDGGGGGRGSLAMQATAIVIWPAAITGDSRCDHHPQSPPDLQAWRGRAQGQPRSAWRPGARRLRARTVTLAAPRCHDQSTAAPRPKSPIDILRKGVEFWNEWQDSSRSVDELGLSALDGVVEIELEHCPNCGGALKIIAAILEAPVIEKALKGLARWTSGLLCIDTLATEPHSASAPSR